MPITPQHGFATREIQLPILSSLGLVKTDNAIDYYKVFKNIASDSIVAELEASGRVDTTPYERYGMWVDASKQRNLFRVTGDVIVTASAAVTVTIANYANATGTLSAPAVGLFFVESTTGIEFEVTAVVKTTPNAHTATIKPTRSGITATIDADDAEFISTGRPTVQESSSQQDGEYGGWTKRFNETSIIRTNKQYSDLTSMVKMEYNGQDYMSIDRDTMNRQHIDAKEFQLIEGDIRNAVTSTGNKNTNAQGLLPLIKQYGTSLDGGGTGVPLNDAFFLDLSRAIDGNGFSQSYKGYADNEAFYKIEAFLKANSGVSVTLNVNNGDRTEIQTIFDYAKNFTIHGIDYDFKKYNYWNVNRLAGADVTKSAKSNQIMLVPDGEMMNGDGSLQSYLRLKVLDNNLATDEGYLNHFDTDGALFGKNTTRNAELSLTSYMGIDVIGIEGFVYVKLS